MKIKIAIVSLLLLSHVTDSQSADLYRVSVSSHEEAASLSASGVDAVLRVSGGYLALAEQDVADRLARSGLQYELVVTGVNRSHLALDVSHDGTGMATRPLVYREGNLRLVQVTRDDLQTAGTSSGLTPLLTRNLPITYQPPTASRSSAYRAAAASTSSSHLS